MIEVKEEKIIINGKEQFILGAEFHYFRVPKSAWEDRFIKIKEAGCNLISTYIPWIFHEQEEGEIDLTGKTKPEKDLKAFLERAKELNFLVLVRPGPYVMSEIKESGIPLWVFENYPDVYAKRADQSRHSIVSYLNKTFLNLVDQWYQAVFAIISPLQISNGGNIIMVQLDNEVGMFPWVMNQADYSEPVIERFIAYLENKYDLNAFETLIQENCSSVSGFVRHAIAHPTEKNGVKLHYEFLWFHRIYFKDYLSALKQIAEKYGLTVPMVVNVHGFHSIDYAKRGTQYPIGLSQLHDACEIENMLLAGDYYVGNIVPDNFHDIILANAFTKAVQPKEQPLFSAEFQSGFQNGTPRLQPTTTDLKTRLCIAGGMNAVNYYMFVGGENFDDIGLMGRRHDWQAPIGTNGDLRPHYFVIQHLSKLLNTYGAALLDAKQKAVISLGFYPEYYLTEYDNEYTRPIRYELQSGRETFLFDGIGKALSFKNMTFDAVDLLKKEKIDIASHPVLWVYTAQWMDAFTQEKLVHYVQEGGKLVLSPQVPVKNFYDEPCTILKDQLKIDIEDQKEWQFITVEDIDQVSAFLTQAYKVKNEESFAYRETDGKVIGLKKSVGKGQLVLFGAGIKSEHDYKMDAYQKVAEQLGIKPVIETDDWLNVTVREGEKGSFIFINNFDEYDKTSTFKFGDELLFDGKALDIKMRSGLILPLRWKLTPDVFIEYSTAEITHKEITETSVKLTIFPRNKEERLVIKTKLKLEVSEDIEGVKTDNEVYQITVRSSREAQITFTL